MRRTRGETLAAEPLESRFVLSTFIVTTVSDSGPGSLRDAITKANALPGADTIKFNIPGAGVKTIQPLTALPALTGPTTIAGNTQPGFAGTPLIELDGSSAGSAASGLVLSGSGVVVRALAINDFTGNGIAISGTKAVVEGCFIGTDDTGTMAESNDLNGIVLLGTKARIGGMTAAARNVISGNGDAGVAIVGEFATGNKVLGNFIGTNAAGTAAIGNEMGVLIADGSKGNVIGGVVAKARNVISGNVAAGVDIATSGNKVQGNFIGTNATGSAALANTAFGVFLHDGATANEVGSAVRGGGNVISGNTSEGVRISGAGTTANKVQGNFIGTDATGNSALANSLNGIRIAGGASENLVGGLTALARNVVSGNTSRGVQIDGAGSDGNVVQGNFVGTNAAGMTAVPNGAQGVIVFATQNNVVGGSVAGAGNVISGNNSEGVSILDTGNFGTVVQGNLIGLNATGTTPIPNKTGIRVAQGAGDAILGGATPLARNVISGNIGAGIVILTSLGANCVIEGNFIGTLKDGSTAAGNTLHGIVLSGGAHNNRIGGTAKGAGNVIAHNGSDGVLIGSDAANGFNSDAGVANSVLGNRIFANAGQAIDLGPNDGATANDAGDADTGANNLVNKPVLTGAVLRGNVLVVTGTLNLSTTQAVRLEFFANLAGEDEGRILLGSVSFTTPASAPFGKAFIVPAGVSAGGTVTATLTDASGNTSEFSLALAIT